MTFTIEAWILWAAVAVVALLVLFLAVIGGLALYYADKLWIKPL